MKLQVLEQEIIKELERVWENYSGEDKNTPWTMAIKNALVSLGHKLSYKVYASPDKELDADWSEWLYDLCWGKERGDKWEDFEGLRLIVEIEWLNDENSILEDFQKLTVGESDCRLFITWQKKNKEDMKLIVNKCKMCCPTNKDHRYLFVALPSTDWHDALIESWIK